MSAKQIEDFTQPETGEVFENYACQAKTPWAAFTMYLAEVIATFTLCSVILSQKYSNDAPDTLKAFAVGLTLTCGACMVGGISGGALNPAVGIV